MIEKFKMYSFIVFYWFISIFLRHYERGWMGSEVVIQMLLLCQASSDTHYGFDVPHWVTVPPW